jgi:hypothetical protein
MITTRDGGRIVLDVLPIEPHGGYIRTAIADVAGTALIAARTHNNYVPERQVRMFIGDVAAHARPGAIFSPISRRGRMRVSRAGFGRCSAW